MASRPLDHRHLTITGYTDRLSARPGESVSVHASSTHQSGVLQLVRLGHDGTSYTKDEIGAPQAIQLAHRHVELGSYGIVDTVSLPAAPFSLHTWVWVSRLPDGAEVAKLLSVQDLALTLDADGIMAFSVGECKVRSHKALQLRRWYQASCGLDAQRRPFVVVHPQRPGWGEARPDRAVAKDSVAWTPRAGALEFGRGLDGKLEDVRISRSESDAGPDIGLRLDFARGISTWLVHDDKGSVVGRVVGLPTRAVQGRYWDGSQHEWRHALHQYAAIHFHSDDQGDQHWPVTATVKLPEDLPSGIYAVELRAGEQADYLPFAVRRKQGQAAPLLFLLPTLTYHAYAFWHMAGPSDRCAQFALANGYHGLYDIHADGSPVVFASIRRPLLNVRPDHATYENAIPWKFPGKPREELIGPYNVLHGLSADLHLVGWLTRQGLDFDVATDHDLDAEGVGMLSAYRAMLTGNHPEYWTARMLDALEAYLDAGGNLANLGGNGFCWATTIDPNDASVAELRRKFRLGARAGFLQHEGDVGEEHFQLTGAPGGPWNNCGRMEGALVGVTSVGGSGLRQGVPYKRTPASFDPRVAHLFAGIAANELIGEKGAILGAAASYECDFAHELLGTPPHALVVATAEMPEGALAMYFPIIEAICGKAVPNRADITFFETPAGGAVLSTGSCGWIGALSHDRDRNAVSRLTANALRAFIERRN